MRNVQFKGNSFEEFNNWLLRDKKTYQRIVRIIQECRRTPFEGLGKPEPLKGNLKGFWSRRIDVRTAWFMQSPMNRLSLFPFLGITID